MMDWLDDFLFTYHNVVVAVGVNGLLALSMYVVLAVGQLSMGQAAFMGLGAYASALLTVKLGAPFAVSLLGAALAPAVVALGIGAPTIKLSGVYLAIATIGLGEVLRVFYLNWDYAGGALGLNAIPARGGLAWIYAALAIVMTAFFLLARSPIGRAMEAMREDEPTAGVIGVNVARYKLGALIASAVIAGLAGAFSAHATSFIAPGEFGFGAAVSILSYALLGGVGSPIAPVLGAAILTVLPEVLRASQPLFEQFFAWIGLADKAPPLHELRFAVNGLIIVIVVLFLPRGVLSWRMARMGAPCPTAAGEKR